MKNRAIVGRRTMNKNFYKHSAAFTIVELLIVIIVIAILATIIVVSYNGVTRSAEETVVKSDLKSAATELGAYFAHNRGYPSSLDGDASIDSDNVSFSYNRYSSGKYCLSATSLRAEGITFNIDESERLQEGACAPPTATPASCFAFSGGIITNYYNNQSNSSSNPACPREVIIPSTIGGSAVTSIGSSAFSGKNLDSVYIPDSVTTIGGYAFQSNVLSSVVIPHSVTSLGGYAFRYNRLTSVSIPNYSSILSSPGIFTGNKLASVTIPDQVTAIANYVFSENELTSLTIPPSVTSIYIQAFASNRIAEVTIPSSVTYLGSSNFASNPGVACSFPSGLSNATNQGCATVTYYTP